MIQWSKSRVCWNCHFYCFLFIILILFVFRLLYRENNSSLYFDDCCFSKIWTLTSPSSSSSSSSSSIVELVNKSNLLITHSFANDNACTFVFSLTSVFSDTLSISLSFYLCSTIDLLLHYSYSFPSLTIFTLQRTRVCNHRYKTCITLAAIIFGLGSPISAVGISLSGIAY